MARSAILSNGRLAVGLNNNGFVHDFYYPYVGLENLTTARSTRHRIGMWLDGHFTWLDSKDWDHTVHFSDSSMQARVTMTSDKFPVTIDTIDFVDYELDAFCRSITVTNNSDKDHEVRIFMHQIFELSSDGHGDTAMYVPSEDYILTYKGRTCLLAGGITDTGASFDQYAVGNYGIEGKEGTFRDAEDGELSGSSVEHGGVDSVMRFTLHIPAKSKSSFNYWVVAAPTPHSGEKLHIALRRDLTDRIRENENHWAKWLSISEQQMKKLPDDQASMARKSLLTIKAHIDSRGGIIASCDSSIYNYGRDYYSYVWPRDGAYAIWPLIRLGYTEEPKLFFKFCADVAEETGYVMHKYQPDRAVGSTWHALLQDGRPELAIQEDETATVIYMIGEYLDYSHDEHFVRTIFDRFVIRAANFLANFVDAATGLPHATYDLWEEKFLTTTYTTATVYGALLTAADLAGRFDRPELATTWQQAAFAIAQRFDAFIDPDTGTLRKGFKLNTTDKSLRFDDTVDMSSWYGCMIYGFYPSHDTSVISKSVEQAKKCLKAENKGMARYENDNYFRTSHEAKPNPWIITTLWLAQYHIRSGNVKEAEDIISWVESCESSGSMLSEQIHPDSKEPISVTPLVWSHAEYINTVLDLALKKSSPHSGQ